MDLSIIVLSYNTKNTTLRCLQELDDLCSNSPQLSIELIVVDNASTDGSKEALQKCSFTHLQYHPIFNTENVGFSKGNNIAIKESKGAYILFLNSDVMVGVEPHKRVVFTHLISYLDNHPSVGALTVRLELSNGMIDPASHRGFPTPWRSFTYFAQLERLITKSRIQNKKIASLFGGYHLLHANLSTIHEIEAGTAAFMLCKASLVKDLGGFDEQFFMYGEDLDLCYRIWKKGFKMIWYPKYTAVHLKYQSGLQARLNTVQKRIKWHFYDAMERFFRKHYLKSTPRLLSWIVVHLISIQKWRYEEKKESSANEGGRKKQKIKRVGIDARLMYQTGVGVYVRNLISNLATYDTGGMEFYLYAKESDIAKFRLQDTKLYKIRKITFRPTPFGWHGVGEQIGFLYMLLRDNLDLMHFTYVSWPILYPKPFVATIHDTTLLTHATGNASTRPPCLYWAKHIVFRFVFSQQVKRAQSLLVPSYAVQKDLLRFYPSHLRKVHVTYEGVDAHFVKVKAEEVPSLQDKPYFLYVGNAYPHKNVETLVKAFSQLHQENSFATLCMVGPKNMFSERLCNRIKDMHLSEVVQVLHDVSVSKLKWLYAHAQAFVFPSYAEGFGLPIVEALYMNCPLILSDIPVFREIAGDHAEFFQPSDTKHLKELLSKALTTQRIDRVTPALLQKFTFSHMTEQVLDIYKGILIV